jgi:hypothetical protein
MKHFYRGVPSLGNVAVSRHAQARIVDENISVEEFEKALLDPIQSDLRESSDIIWRERNGVRLIILTSPTPNLGAALVKTVFRGQMQASAVRR